MTLRLGLAQGLVPTDPAALTPQRAAQIAALGVTAIVTHFEVAPANLVGSRGREIAAILADSGLRIVQCAGAGANLVSADEAIRRRGIAALAELMRAAKSLDAEMVLTGCGSLHATHPYGPAHENHSDRTRERLVDSLRHVAQAAEQAGMPVALEPHVLTTLDTPENVRAVLDEVDSNWIQANFDPVNFLGSLDAVYASGDSIRHALATLGPRLAPSAHIKDVVVEAELVLHIAEVPPGDGVLDLAAVLTACRELPESSALIVEHLSAEAAPAALRVVSELATMLGIKLA